MELVTQALTFSKDLGLFLVYSCGCCASIAFDAIISCFPSIYGIVSKIVLFFKDLFLTPVHIIITVLFQLFLLPVNIPLRLLLGTSLKHILVNANSWTDGYVITTVLQYLLALTAFGVSIGAICGTGLSVIHSVWKIPDIYIDVPVQFWRIIPSIWELIKQDSMPSYKRSVVETANDDDSVSNQAVPSYAGTPMKTSSLPDMPSTPKYRYDPKRWSRPSSISKESILKVASKLPSDFFQQGQFGNGFDEEIQSKLSPSQFSQTTTQNSSADFTNIWDKIEESPITLRTDDGLTSLSKRKTFSDTNKNGTLAVK